MKSSFDFLSALADLAKAHGVIQSSMGISDRRNRRGRYDYIEVSFVNPYPKEKKSEEVISEIESDTITDEESEKDEVLNHEI